MLGPLNFEVFLEGLTPYTTYQIKVNAFTSAGVGPWSPIVRKSTLQGGNSLTFRQLALFAAGI